MIKFHDSMNVAQALLSVVNARINDDEGNRLSVSAYSNGREQGYHISGWNLTTHKSLGISFAECRNSDSIVVYVGESTDFSMQGNVPDEETYRACNHFKYDDYVGAADFIIEKIKDFAKSPVATI